MPIIILNYFEEVCLSTVIYDYYDIVDLKLQRIYFLHFSSYVLHLLLCISNHICLVLICPSKQSHMLLYIHSILLISSVLGYRLLMMDYLCKLSYGLKEPICRIRTSSLILLREAPLSRKDHSSSWTLSGKRSKRLSGLSCPDPFHQLRCHSDCCCKVIPTIVSPLADNFWANLLQEC